MKIIRGPRMNPAVVDLHNHVSGWDTWAGLTIGPVTVEVFDESGVPVSDGPPEFQLTECHIEFHELIGGRLAATLSSSDPAQLQITDAANWQVLAPIQPLGLPAMKYIWCFRTLDSAGVKRTIYRGNFNVLGCQ